MANPLPNTGSSARPGWRAALGRNVIALALVSLFTDVSSEMIYPLLPLFMADVLHTGTAVIGAIEGAAETTASLLKLASGWWSDRVTRRKPLVLAGYVLASVARPLVAAATSSTHVLIVRLTDRVGKGIRTSPRDALIADSVAPEIRGRAFGFHRSADHLGAVLGPLIAFALLRWMGVPLRTVFWLAAIPGAIAVLVLAVGVKEIEKTVSTTKTEKALPTDPHRLGRPFWTLLAVLLLFTLGNSSDAFLLLRARQLGVSVAAIPVLWAVLHVVKSASSTPGGALSDRIGRRPLIVAGWTLYALVYGGFAFAQTAWQAWALFAVYGVYFGLSEGTEKAMVADLVPAERRGAAYGWYNLAIGLGALPASLIFGMVWQRAGAPTAFILGAGLALLAAVGILLLVPRSQQQREPGRA